MEELITDILLSASLCADCFAVALCSSVTMKKVTLAQVLQIALIFAIIQTSFLFVGWAFGDFIARYLMHFVKWIGMGILVFVGVSMIREAFSEEKPRNLTGFLNIVLAGIADSIDALAVGISCSGRVHHHSPVSHYRHQGRKPDWNQSRQTCCRVRRCCPYIAGNQYLA